MNSLKAKAPAALITALFLLLAPTALAGERTEAAPRVAQAQPAPTAPAEQVAPTALADQPAKPAPADQPQIQVAQTNPPPAGDDNRRATLGDIRWSHDNLRAEIREIRADMREIRAEIKALYIAVVTGLVAIVAALLGIIALLIPRRNAPAAAPKTALPRPTSA